MKLRNLTKSNIDKFFEVVDNCEGKIELVSEDFRLNLKSKVAQYVSVAKIFCNGDIDEIEILAYNQNDVTKLINFMINN